MNKTYFFVMALVLTFSGYAQKKPKVNKANSARESGDLAEAKSIIDEAIVHEKTKDDGKTWYFRGLIYATIDTTSNAEYANLSKSAMEEAVKAFNKADEIDPEGKNYYTTGEFGIPVLMDQQVSGYYSYYYNQAVEAFQNKEFQKAVDNFESSYYIMPEDTNSYVNAAYAAHNGELYDAAIKNYRGAIDAGSTSIELYYNCLNILLTAKDDKEAALALIEEGLGKFPGDGTLSKNKINILIELGRIEEAKADLLSAIDAEPDNAGLYFTLGVMYDELEDTEKAKEAYKNGIKANPNHFESNFNYGVLLINEANEVIKQNNNLGMSKADQKKSKELQPVIDGKLKAALPQWEKIYELKPSEKTAIETLAYIYNQLGMRDKAKKMSEKLD
ncbi:MAG: hypothetical protein RIC35_14625 [Marinoscillum sp.]